MAITVTYTGTAVSRELLDRANALLEEAGLSHPPGRKYLFISTQGDAVSIFSVWESREQFDAFYEKLVPIDLAAGLPKPPVPEISELVDVIVAG